MDGVKIKQAVKKLKKFSIAESGRITQEVINEAISGLPAGEIFLLIEYLMLFLQEKRRNLADLSGFNPVRIEEIVCAGQEIEAVISIIRHLEIRARPN